MVLLTSPSADLVFGRTQAYHDRSWGWPDIEKIKCSTHFLPQSRHFITRPHGMKTGSESAFGAGYNVLPIWKKRLDAKTLVTTPNSEVFYAMSYVDLGKERWSAGV